MTDKQTPPDWVLKRAAPLAGYGPDNLLYYYAEDRSFRALCDMIQKYEPPVDPLAEIFNELNQEGFGK